METAVPASRVPPPRDWTAVAAQRWDHVAFLHWQVDRVAVAGLLPPGTRPDLFDGRAYVGLVPLRMSGVRVGRKGPVVVPDFWETNVRVYSVDDAGRHGVVFLSLDAERLAVVGAARLGLGVPYVWSHLGGAARDGERVWSVRRRGRAGAGAYVRLHVGAAEEPTPLETFLTARWGVHTAHLGRTWWIPARHAPWPLHVARTVAVRAGVLPAVLDVSGAPTERALYSPGVAALLGRPVPVR